MSTCAYHSYKCQISQFFDTKMGLFLFRFNILLSCQHLWKLNPIDRTITLTKLLIKHAKLTPKETEIGA